MTEYQQTDSDVFCNEYACEANEQEDKPSPVQSYCSNFKSGYMPVNPEYIEKLQFTGRKTFAFWTLVVILIILAIGNLCLTFIILSVLRLGGNMESIEFIQKQDAIKFFGETDLGHLYKRNGKIEGFKDVPIEVSSQDSSVIFSLSSKFGRVSTKFKMNQNSTTFDSINKFVVRDENDKLIYSSVDPSFNSIKSANNLKTKLTLTNRITSPLKEDLNIQGKLVNFKGAEGTTINGKLVFWSADQDLHFKTVNGSIIMTSKKDIFINMKNVPTGALKQNNHLRTQNQYKICVCMPQGKLFRIPVSGLNSVVSCNHVNMSPQHNPCY
ncbi:uncharacterized protein LOC123316553 [Coccinella septempunctata]|uniref:uncharacterized protein LOC123316553 n=1 Tax=Coccinella septempunctata TaxID=41139 RepID=UPI001D06A29B|nr:uncharacterized protein LOC123316553 [Coccinella septempunctata]